MNGCSTGVTKTNSSLVSANNGYFHHSWWFHFFNQSFFLFYFFSSLSLCFCAISGALHVFATLLHVRRHCLGCWHSIKRLAAVVDGVAKHYGSVLQDFPYATRPLKEWLAHFHVRSWWLKSHRNLYRIRMNQGIFALFCSNTSILKLLKRLVTHEVSSLQLHSDATGTSNQFDCMRLIYLARGFVVHLAWCRGTPIASRVKRPGSSGTLCWVCLWLGKRSIHWRIDIVSL